METLSSSFSISKPSVFEPFTSLSVRYGYPIMHKSPLNLSLHSCQFSRFSSVSLSPSTRLQANLTSGSSLSTSSSFSSTKFHNFGWIVLMERLPEGANSKTEIMDYFVMALERVLGSKKDAETRIYDTFCDSNFGFRCSIDEEASRELASLPGVLAVSPDPDFNSDKTGYGSSMALDNLSIPQSGGTLLFPGENTKQWLVRIDKPGVGVVTKAQMVDYYSQILTKVLGNEKDAQMCIYHISWQTNFGFCCELDEECAHELTGIPGVLSVQLDKNFDSENKDYRGENAEMLISVPNSLTTSQSTATKTKKLFITGLSFYTSEKTLRAAFEGFGELVEVKIIMDKISKRSKGYAFVEYTTEEAACAALKEMNGKIINGWMIVVDVAKSSPPKYGRGRPRPRPVD
ncbi:hypothetical protein K2173_024092 [Erythroxylum novogranatense]|uniref:RRM domain-containing protein n=1 Tax=Erythroxylum novogranatense TaxID=1862640 RepID=A0AAV8UGP5_9ROSI|nr:hypothetical protein K2173_024092 [Erythroxylum novogranatense]